MEYRHFISFDATRDSFKVVFCSILINFEFYDDMDWFVKELLRIKSFLFYGNVKEFPVTIFLLYSHFEFWTR